MPSMLAVCGRFLQLANNLGFTHIMLNLLLQHLKFLIKYHVTPSILSLVIILILTLVIVETTSV